MTMTSDDKLVGAPPGATNQPTTEANDASNPDEPTWQVTIAADDLNRIYVGDPCPGHQVIGKGLVSASREWTELVFEDGLNPLELKHLYIRAGEIATTAVDVIDRLTAERDQAMADGAHMRDGLRVTTKWLVDIMGPDEAAGAKALQEVYDYLSKPGACDICDRPLPGESQGEFVMWAALDAISRGQAIREMNRMMDECEDEEADTDGS